MSILYPAAPRASIEVEERCYTAADLAAMPRELPSGPVRYELDNGRLVSMAPPGNEHGAVEARLTYHLMHQAARRGLGVVRVGETGIVLWRNPDRVVGADLLFVARDSLPIRESPQGYLETIPDLVAEVVSKNDTAAYVRRKVEDYLTAGVRVVLVADPSGRTITIHRPGTEPIVLREGETLTVEDVIPGFSMPVGEAFAE